MISRPIALAAIPALIFAAAALLLALGLNRDPGSGVTAGLIDRPAPPLELTPLPGLELPPSDGLASGAPALINFWASWCAPCRAEHPNLTRLADRGLVIHGVNYRDKTSDALGFLTELGNPYATAGADPNGQAALAWGVYGIPETFLVNGEGLIVFRHAGPLTSRIVEERLEPLISEGPG